MQRTRYGWSHQYFSCSFICPVSHAIEKKARDAKANGGEAVAPCLLAKKGGGFDLCGVGHNDLPEAICLPSDERNHKSRSVSKLLFEVQKRWCGYYQ